MLESSGKIAGISNINNLRYDILGRVGQLAYPLKQPRQPFLLQMVNKPPLCRLMLPSLHIGYPEPAGDTALGIFS